MIGRGAGLQQTSLVLLTSRVLLNIGPGGGRSAMATTDEGEAERQISLHVLIYRNSDNNRVRRSYIS